MPGKLLFGYDRARSGGDCTESMGVRTGIYIEGYLCDERGLWGRENVAKYDIREADGKPLLWDGAPTEHMMCPAEAQWREHLADTYRRVAGELKQAGIARAEWERL